MRDIIISNVKIAVVDHDVLIRDFVVSVLMYNLNQDILTFRHIDDLQSYLKAGHKIHMVLSELHLPDRSGFELLRYIKQYYPQIYFIAMSGNPADEIPAGELDADVYLAKPFALPDLFAIVDRFVMQDTLLKTV